MSDQVPPCESPVDATAEAFVIRSGDDDLVEVRRLGQPVSGLREADRPDRWRSVLGPLLREAHRAPSLIAKSMLASKSWYLVEFAPKVAEGLRAGSLEFTRMADKAGAYAIARDQASKRFVGNPILLAAAKPTAIVTAAWELCAIITAQKYLADIQRQLEIIEKGIRSVHEWQKVELLATIEAKRKYLEQVQTALGQSNLRLSDLDVLRGPLESMELEWLKDIGQLRVELTKPLKELKSQRWAAPWIGTETLENNRGAAVRSMLSFEQNATALICAVAFRSATLHARAALGLGCVAASVLADLRQIAAEVRAETDSVSGFVEKQVPFLQSHWRGPEAERQAQDAIRENDRRIHSGLIRELKLIDEGLNHLEVNLREASSPMPLRLQISADPEGKVSDVLELPAGGVRPSEGG